MWGNRRGYGRMCFSRPIPQREGEMRQAAISTCDKGQMSVVFGKSRGRPARGHCELDSLTTHRDRPQFEPLSTASLIPFLQSSPNLALGLSLNPTSLQSHPGLGTVPSALTDRTRVSCHIHPSRVSYSSSQLSIATGACRRSRVGQFNSALEYFCLSPLLQPFQDMTRRAIAYSTHRVACSAAAQSLLQHWQRFHCALDRSSDARTR